MLSPSNPAMKKSFPFSSSAPCHWAMWDQVCREALCRRTPHRLGFRLSLKRHWYVIWDPLAYCQYVSLPTHTGVFYPS